MKFFVRRPSRSTRRLLLTLETLEDRTLLSGDLLVTTEIPGVDSYRLMHYTQQGVLVSAQPVPLAPGSNETSPDARGLSVSPSGNVNIFDGTFYPSLASYSPNTNAWSFQSLSGWSTIAVENNGQIAAYKNFVFAPDEATYGGEDSGLIRFDTSGGSAVRFDQGMDFSQATLGIDGLLYAPGGIFTGYGQMPVQVFNPDTLTHLKTITLQGGPDTDIRSIAVDGSGQFFAATWGGYIAKYDANGNYTGSSVHVGDSLLDLTLDTDGQIAAGGRFGEIYLTNESLTSVQTISTRQWNVFVTFDHYIGTAPQLVTPSFSNLAGPTITYGQSTVTLGGQIAANSAIPPGSVNITLDGITQSATINSTDGTFSSVFDTSTLGVSNSPYTITYSYPATGNYTAISDASQSLTVNSATTALNNLSSPTVVIGTPNVTLSGTVGSNSVLPVGQSVSVTIAGANGSFVKGSGTIASDGSFQATLNTSALPAGAYTIQYQYAGDANFVASNGTGTLQVTYNVNLLSGNTKPVRSGHTLSIKLQVTDASGNNLSSADLAVTAISIIGPNGATYTPNSKGKPNSNNAFSYAKSSYSYNLDTAGLTPGTYSLMVKVGNDPVLHAISFVVD